MATSPVTRAIAGAITRAVVGFGNAWAGNAPPAGAPTISGTATEGQTLTASVAGISDADGIDTDGVYPPWIFDPGIYDEAGFAHQWLRDGVAISGATSSTYVLTASDVGALISVRVGYVDNMGKPETVTSATVGPVGIGWTAIAGDGTTYSGDLTVYDEGGSSYTLELTVYDASGNSYTLN